MFFDLTITSTIKLQYFMFPTSLLQALLNYSIYIIIIIKLHVNIARTASKVWPHETTQAVSNSASHTIAQIDIVLV